MKKVVIFLFVLFLANILFAQNNNRNCLDSFSDTAYRVSKDHEFIQTISVHCLTCKDKIPLSKATPIQEEWRIEKNTIIIDTLPKELWGEWVYQLRDLIKGGKLEIPIKNPYLNFSPLYAKSYSKVFFYNGKNFDYVIKESWENSIWLHVFMLLHFLFLFSLCYLTLKKEKSVLMWGSWIGGAFLVFTFFCTFLEIPVFTDWFNVINLILLIAGIIIVRTIYLRFKKEKEEEE